MQDLSKHEICTLWNRIFLKTSDIKLHNWYNLIVLSNPANLWDTPASSSRWPSFDNTLQHHHTNKSIPYSQFSHHSVFFCQRECAKKSWNFTIAIIWLCYPIQPIYETPRRHHHGDHHSIIHCNTTTQTNRYRIVNSLITVYFSVKGLKECAKNTGVLKVS